MRIEPRQPQVYQLKDVAREITTKPLPKFEPAPAQGGIPWDQALKTTGGCCMWPLWPMSETKGNVCGEELHLLNKGTKREKASPYCEAHHRRAYHQTMK